jgi:hypothetical protein
MSEETSNGAPPSKRKRTTPVIPKTPLEAQKIQLEKLMADPVNGAWVLSRRVG